MKFLELNKNVMPLRPLMTSQLTIMTCERRLKLRLQHLVLTIFNHGNLQWFKRKDELAKGLPLANKLQVEQAQYVIALFSDTDLALRSRKIARIGVKSLPDDLIGYYMETLPPRFASFNEVQTGEYLAINAGIVAMNLVLALTDQKQHLILFLVLISQRPMRFQTLIRVSVQNC